MGPCRSYYHYLNPTQFGIEHVYTETHLLYVEDTEQTPAS